MWKVLLITGTVYFIYIIFGGCVFVLLDKIDALGLETVFFEKNDSGTFTDMESTLLENFSQSEIDGVVSDWKSEFSKNYFSDEAVEIGHLHWTYSNAFFFAFHLCSTIGYGNIAPVTPWGQMIAIIYATLGIPLHVIFFKILGESFARSYQKIMFTIQGDSDSPVMERLGNLAFFIPWTFVFFILPSIVFMFTENWSLVEGVYYSFITLSTVGLGDYVADSWRIICLTSYQKIVFRIQGDRDSPGKERLDNLAFFIPFTFVFFLLSSIVFMFTENWNLIEGVYYSFITLSTVSLGDYVAGNKVTSEITYTIYKLIILVWMLYGLAFTTLVVDYLTHLFQMYLFFSFKCKWKKCFCKMERIYVDIEKMDIHFKLLRAEAIKEKYSMWSVREGTRQAIGFRTNHMVNVAALSERIQGEIMDIFSAYESEELEDDLQRAPKDAFPVKEVPKDAFPVREGPKNS